MRIVIADDSEIVRDRIQRLLADIPRVQIVGEVGDIHQVLNMVREMHAELVLLDLQMPGGSGINIIRHLKLLNPPPIVMVFTNNASSDYHTQCLEEGADFFFDKSFEFEKIWPTIMRLME